MSLILDALRKMEQERKARRQGGTDIRPEVLSYRGAVQKPNRFAPMLPVTAAVVILLAAGIGGWFLLKEEKSVPASFPKVTTVPKNVTPAQVQPTTSSPQPQATDLPPPVQQRPIPVAPRQAVSPTPQQEQKPPEVSTTPGITISGIAYQDERTLRRAVINGSLVGEGAEVAGMKVVEIRENRIRFSRAGEVFDLLYSTGISNHQDVTPTN